MPVNRLYAETIKEEVRLSRDEMRHLTKVLRHRDGDNVEVVDGKGTLARALLKGERLIVTHREEAPPPTQLVLIQGLPALPKLEHIIEKGTELGVTTFMLFPAHRSRTKAISPSKRERLRAITIAAMKQCGRLYLPEIEVHTHLTVPDFPLYCASLTGKGKLRASTPCAIAIGPESGFTQEEEAQLGTPFSLHHNTLRSETAAIAALAQVWHH